MLLVSIIAFLWVSMVSGLFAVMFLGDSYHISGESKKKSDFTSFIFWFLEMRSISKASTLLLILPLSVLGFKSFIAGSIYKKSTEFLVEIKHRIMQCL